MKPAAACSAEAPLSISRASSRIKDAESPINASLKKSVRSIHLSHACQQQTQATLRLGLRMSPAAGIRTAAAAASKSLPAKKSRASLYPSSRLRARALPVHIPHKRKELLRSSPLSESKSARCAPFTDCRFSAGQMK